MILIPPTFFTHYFFLNKKRHFQEDREKNSRDIHFQKKKKIGEKLETMRVYRQKRFYCYGRKKRVENRNDPKVELRFDRDCHKVVEKAEIRNRSNPKY